MNASTVLDGPTTVDPIEEMQLRTWARRHFVPVEERRHEWHAIVLDEMSRVDGEAARR